ncbi:MAG TPA: hypothetical protein V6D33_17295 [Cyanophyceae cyanobacterium]
MEILAIVVLGVSAFLSFSTSEHKPKLNTPKRKDDDADVAFTEAYQFDESVSSFGYETTGERSN